MPFKIGIVGSGYEVAMIASWLPEGCELHCFIDWAWWPWTSKSRDDILPRVEHLVGEAERVGVDRILVPPCFEEYCKKQNTRILPLFTTYLRTYVLPASRVGKIGLMSASGMAGVSQIKSSLQGITQSYTCTDYQQKTSVFNPKFPTRSHDMSHRTLHLPYAKKRSWMMRNLIKHDLRHFKNDDVDTLVPCDRGMLYREVMIRHRLGARMKFHGSKQVRETLVGLLGPFMVGENIGNGVERVKDISFETTVLDGDSSIPYVANFKEIGYIPPCFVYCTADPEAMMNDKNWRQLFDRGGKREVRMERM